MRELTFRKEERLSRKKLIDSLFTEGKVVKAFPVRAVWMFVPLSEFPAQVLFSVPKRKFKKATERNKIRRQMREIYRKNKSWFYAALHNNEQSIALALMYGGNDMPQFKELSDKIILTLQRLAEDVSRHTLKNKIS